MCRYYPVFDGSFKSNPFPFYDDLRAAGPIARIEFPTGGKAWLVTEYELISKLVRDPRLLKNPRPTTPNWLMDHINHVDGRSMPNFGHLLTVDPPDHTRLRALMADDFSPAQIAGWRGHVERVVDEVLDQLDPHATIDFVSDFAMTVPVVVFCDLLGLPVADQPQIQRWAKVVLSAPESELGLVPVAIDELWQYLLQRARDVRARPDDSVFCRLVQASDRGELTEEEMLAMGSLLLVAGFETTAGLLSTGLLILQQTAGAWARLRDSPEEGPRIVEELLRLCSPLEVSTPRFARQPIELETATIEAGDVVYLGYAAANRDPGHFDCPHSFNADRQASAHMAFGQGIHYCLGANLARLEANVAFIALSQRFPNLTLVDTGEDLSWRTGLWLRSLQRLPVQLCPERVYAGGVTTP